MRLTNYEVTSHYFNLEKFLIQMLFRSNIISKNISRYISGISVALTLSPSAEWPRNFRASRKVRPLRSAKSQRVGVARLVKKDA